MPGKTTQSKSPPGRCLGTRAPPDKYLFSRRGGEGVLCQLARSNQQGCSAQRVRRSVFCSRRANSCQCRCGTPSKNPVCTQRYIGLTAQPSKARLPASSLPAQHGQKVRKEQILPLRAPRTSSQHIHPGVQYSSKALLQSLPRRGPPPCSASANSLCGGSLLLDVCS